MPPAHTPAPPPPPFAGDSVDLRRAEEEALLRDPELRAARRRVDAARWRAVQESLPPNPVLAGTVLPTEWAVRLVADLTALLDVGGARRARTQAALARRDRFLLDLARREVEAVRQVRLAYAELLAHRRLQALQEARAGAHREILETARGMQEAGEASELEVLAAHRALHGARAAADAQAEATALWAARLGRWLGRPPGERVAPAEEDFPLPDPLSTTPAGEVARLGLARRPEVALAAARVREQQARLGLAEVAWIPRVEGGPVVARTGRGEDTAAGGAVSVVLPFLDRGQGQRGAEAAELQALEEETRAVAAAVVLDVHEKVLELRRASAAREHLAGQASAAARRRQILEGMLEAGAASRIQVLEARAEELAARAREGLALRDRWKALVELAAALGDRPETPAPRGERGD